MESDLKEAFELFMKWFKTEGVRHCPGDVNVAIKYGFMVGAATIYSAIRSCPNPD